MEQDFSPPLLSVYIHIPFCLSRCGYCSFFSLPYHRLELETYVACLHQEKELYADYLRQSLGTLYFGGGTPSLLNSQQINSICENLDFARGAEISLEVNPVQITESFLKGLKTTPVNRLSLGLQSMNDADLIWLERKHRSAQIENKLNLCHGIGFNNLSLDLIYGLPESNLDQLKRILDDYLKLQPQHISCYPLSLAEGCRSFAYAYNLPDDDAVADQYDLIRTTLKQAGFHHYEISNFALPGYESQHNLAYWKNSNYLALGASAAGFVDNIRYLNPANLAEYYAGVQAGRRFPNSQAGDFQRQREDYLMMGLRLTEGIDELDFKQRFGMEIETLHGEKIERLIKQGLLKRGGGKLAVSETALFISNAVIAELIL